MSSGCSVPRERGDALSRSAETLWRTLVAELRLDTMAVAGHGTAAAEARRRIARRTAPGGPIDLAYAAVAAAYGGAVPACAVRRLERYARAPFDPDGEA